MSVCHPGEGSPDSNPGFKKIQLSGSGVGVGGPVVVVTAVVVEVPVTAVVLVSVVVVGAVVDTVGPGVVVGPLVVVTTVVAGQGSGAMLIIPRIPKTQCTSQMNGTVVLGLNWGVLMNNVTLKGAEMGFPLISPNRNTPESIHAT